MNNHELIMRMIEYETDCPKFRKVKNLHVPLWNDYL